MPHPLASIGRNSDIARVTDIWVLLGAGRTGFRRDRAVLAFHEPELLRDLRAGRRFLRLGAAEGGDTSHILGSFMKLRRCAGYLRACHDQQGIPAPARTGGPEEGDGCVRRVCESAWTAQAARGSVKLTVSALVEGAGTCREC